MSTDIDIYANKSAVITRNNRNDGFTDNVTAASSTSKRISIRNNVFRYMVNGKEITKTDNRHLDVVIVNASPVHRVFFSQGYNPNVKAEPPKCWTSNSINPDPTVPNPQASSCASCPQNIKGSGQNGTKACRFSRRIAVVLADDLEGDVFQITLPSQSIFGNGNDTRRPLGEYADHLKAFGSGLMSVVSRMSFDPDSSSTKVGFRAIAELTDEQYEICQRQHATEASTRAITLTVASEREDGDSPDEFAPRSTPQNVQASPLPKFEPEAKPVVTEAPAQATVEDEVPEPQVRAAQPTKKVPEPPKNVDLDDVSLDDLVNDWTT